MVEFMGECKELVERLRNDRARYICDDELSISQVILDCTYAADAIERLIRELAKKQIENTNMNTELQFTREFIIRNGLQYALASEWSTTTI